MKKFRSRFTSVGWYYLVVLLFILAGSILQQLNLLMLLFALMVFPLFWNWRTARRFVSVLIPRRNAPAFIHAGMACRAGVKLRNPRRYGRCWSILVRDRLVRISPRPRSYTLTSWTLQVPPRGEAVAAHPPVRLPRGIYQWQELQLECCFPLGLVRSICGERREQTLVVYPAAGRLTQAWRTRGGHRIQWYQGARRRRSLLEGEFYGLRDYLPGDNRRWIHWRSSARREELIVRQFEESPARRLCLVLDLWTPRGSEPNSQETQTLEDMLSFVAAVLEDQVRQNASGVWLILAAGRIQEVRGPANTETLHRAWRLLAGAWPEETDVLPLVRQRCGAALNHQTELLVVSLAPRELRKNKLERLSGRTGRLLWVDPQTLPRYFHPEREADAESAEEAGGSAQEQYASAAGGEA